MKIRGPDSNQRRLTSTSLIGLFGVAFAVLSGAGCPRHLPIARPYPAPNAADLAGVIGARQKVISSMNARVRATSWLGGDRVRATVLMLVDRPGRLRLEAEVSLQGTVAILATDGQTFGFLDMQKNELRRGPACPANVASLIRIPLGPADVAAILLGDARLPAAGDDGTVDWDETVGADVLAIRRDDGWLRLLFKGAGAAGVDRQLVGAVATWPDGRARWRVAFEDFNRVTVATPPASVSLPQTIRFAEGSGSFDDGVEIKFKERTLNDVPAPGSFTLTPSAGTTVVDIGCPPGTPAGG